MKPTTARRLPLSRDLIIGAALAHIDARGLQGFTMRSLGQELGVDPMAIYHHLPNKDAVFDGIVELLWSEVTLPPQLSRESWQSELHAVFCAVRQTLLAHPHAAMLLGTRPALTPASLRLIDTLLGRLGQAGLPGASAMQLLDCLSAFTVGKVLAEVGGASGAGHEDKVQVATGALTVETHPQLFKAFASGYTFAPDEQFDRGLRALIMGWSLPAAESRSTRA